MAHTHKHTHTHADDMCACELHAPLELQLLDLRVAPCGAAPVVVLSRLVSGIRSSTGEAKGGAGLDFRDKYFINNTV